MAFTCPDVVCDMHTRTWVVECADDGVPLDEADTRCPECYSEGLRVQHQPDMA